MCESTTSKRPRIDVSPSPTTQTTHIGKHINFPDEILDAIIGALGPLRCDSNKHMALLDIRKISRTWQACCLASKRLRNITLPHLFHSVKIMFPEERLVPYIKFLEKTPWVAVHVREFQLSCDELDARVLESLLEVLPSLRSLILDIITVYSDIDLDRHGYGRHLNRNYALKRLDYRSVPGEECASLEYILPLFSWIGDLVVAIGMTNDFDLQYSTDAEDHIEEFISRSVVGKTRIENVICGGDAYIGRFLPIYLHRIGAMDHLRYLAFRVRGQYSARTLVCFLEATRDTLEALCIEIVVNGGTDDYLVDLKTILPSCKGIKDIKAVLIVGQRMRFYDYHKVTRQQHLAAQTHVDNWSLALQVLELVPVVNLNHASVCLDVAIGDIHILDWDHFKTWISTVPELKTVEVSLEQIHDQRSCLAYEMRGYEHLFTPSYVRIDIMAGTRGVRRRGPPNAWRCHHEGCCKYAEEHSLLT